MLDEPLEEQKEAEIDENQDYGFKDFSSVNKMPGKNWTWNGSSMTRNHDHKIELQRLKKEETVLIPN